MSGTSVLLGLFDGVHRGHRAALGELLKQSGERIVYTFDSESVTPKGERGLLMTDAEKREALLSLGADGVISKKFSEIKDLSPEDFVEKVLVRELGAKKVICGENFRFGRGGLAGADELMRLCAANDVGFKAVPLLYDGGEPISTTRIRKLIESGEISEANRLLGYEYGFDGKVSHGYGLGTEMGIKTLNLPYDRSLALPRLGVYASRISLAGKRYFGVTNVGKRPTVRDDGVITVETHALGLSSDSYGEPLRVGLVEFIREEKRFGSKDELVRAVANDIKAVKELFKDE